MKLMVSLISLIHCNAGSSGKRLEKTLRERFFNLEFEFYDSNGSLYERLCQPSRYREYEIYILLADTRERLEKLMDLGKLLDGKRLVLIVPGNDKKLLSMGHRLLPRYLSAETENFEELVLVLEKMIKV